MSKEETRNLYRLDVSILNKYDVFCVSLKAELDFYSKLKINVESIINESLNDRHIKLSYLSDGKEINDNFIIITTKPNYGGLRYWFQCHGLNDRVFCGKKVHTLFKYGDYFACRECHDLTYRSRNLSGIKKKYCKVEESDVKEAFLKVKKRTYKGKPTKSYLRYLKKSKLYDDSMRELYSLL